MKCLSLWQPWASLIACGAKTVETRSWAPPRSILGTRIGIHAGKKKPSTIGITPYIIHGLRQAQHSSGIDPKRLDELPRGCIIATAIVQGAWRVEQIKGPMGAARAYGTIRTDQGYEYAVSFPIDRFGDYSVGRWLWFLWDVQVLDQPLVCNGRQRIFEIDQMPEMAEVGDGWI